MLTLRHLTKVAGLNESTNSWALSPSSAYKERVVYDANGNILKYLRNDQGNTRRDSLTYYYYTGTNKLRRVRDSAGQWLYYGDLDNQIRDSNYVYDEIGNLIIDTSENILPSAGGIKWNVYGKITEINRSAATTLTNVKKINYYYDTQGNRIGKTVEKFGTSVKDYVWYVRDAQGNVLNVYSASGNVSDPKDLYINLVERYLYGSARLGVDQWSIPTDSDTTLYDMAWFTTATYKRGWRQYELSNHLGNVLVSITDRKFGVPLGGGSSLIDYYTADVVNAQDYYPFGFRMPGRGYNNGPVYRFGFNGKENDRDVKGDGNQYDYGFRIYDPRIGRFLSVDPIMKNFPELTPYQFASNRPIDGIDQDGLEWDLKTVDQNLGIKGQQTKLYQPFQPTISATKKTWTQQWRDSKNIIGNITYDIANGIYTLPQQLTASIRKEKYVYNIGGNGYRAHGIWDEKQRLKNFVNGATVFVPGAAAETRAEGLIAKYADNVLAKYGDDVLPKIEQQVTEQISSYTGANIEKAVWAQKRFGDVFSSGGKFTEKTVDEIAEALKSGAFSVTDVPIDVVVRNGQTFILNTRSSVALTKAGIPRSLWSVANRTGQEFFENQLNGQFQRNPSINGTGTNTIINSKTKEVITH